MAVWPNTQPMGGMWPFWAALESSAAAMTHHLLPLQKSHISFYLPAKPFQLLLWRRWWNNVARGLKSPSALTVASTSWQPKLLGAFCGSEPGNNYRGCHHHVISTVCAFGGDTRVEQPWWLIECVFSEVSPIEFPVTCYPILSPSMGNDAASSSECMLHPVAAAGLSGGLGRWRENIFLLLVAFGSL